MGQKDTRKITLLRQSGPDTPLAYSLQWHGNDGTFKASDAEVSCPTTRLSKLRSRSRPRQPGVHSAQLYLDR